jgi:cytochrome c556
MTRLIQIVAGFAFVAAVALPAVVHADPTDDVDYRKHVMKSMGAQAAILASMAQQKIPADNFALHAQSLALSASTALKAFEPNSPGGDAKPEVWAKWADFSKRMNELAANTAEFAKLAQSGGMAAAAPKMQTTFTCKGCHDTYREQKK